MKLKQIISVIILITIVNITYAEITTEISLNKSEYLEAEPIIFTIKFENNSALIDSVNIDFIEQYNNFIKIKCDKEKEFFGNFGIGDHFGGIIYQKFSPKQQVVRVRDLSNTFGDVRLKYSLNGRRLYLSEGRYVVKYENGAFSSNELVFNVKRPLGTDLEAFEKLIRAYQINDGKPWTMDSILLKRDIYYEVAVNYPESVYFDEAVYRYNEETEYLHVDSLDIKMDKEYLEKFPDSFFMFTILKTLSTGIYKFEGGEIPVNEYLNYIQSKYPNLGISALAKQILEEKTYLN